MIGKFNITKLGTKDKILLGIPWLRAMNPAINWTAQTLSLPFTLKSVEIDNYVKHSKKPSSPSLRIPKTENTPVMENFNTKEDIWVASAKISKELLQELDDGRDYLRTMEEIPFITPSKFSNKAQEFATEEKVKQKKIFEELIPAHLHDFSDVFAKDGLNQLPPERPGIDHRIEMKPGFLPKTSKIYPLSPKEQLTVKSFIDENLAKGFIVKSKSPQASGFFFVGKKSGKLRPCQDYRYLNEHTIRNSYPLPLPASLIER